MGLPDSRLTIWSEDDDGDMLPDGADFLVRGPEAAGSQVVFQSSLEECEAAVGYSAWLSILNNAYYPSCDKKPVRRISRVYTRLCDLVTNRRTGEFAAEARSCA